MRVATHVIVKVNEKLSHLNLRVVDYLYPANAVNSFTNQKMEKEFGNDGGLYAWDIGEVTEIEIWNTPLYEALK